MKLAEEFTVRKRQTKCTTWGLNKDKAFKRGSRVGQLCDCGWDLLGPLSALDQQYRTAVRAALIKIVVRLRKHTFWLLIRIIWCEEWSPVWLVKSYHSRLLPVSYITESSGVMILRGRAQTKGLVTFNTPQLKFMFKIMWRRVYLHRLAQM